MEISINLWNFPYFSGKSRNAGHCHPKHHCYRHNSSPTTLISIIISKNIMLSIQNKLWSKKHTLPSCGVDRIPAPGRPGEGPREPGRTCARAVFCLENSMSAHKKCSNFFLRQDFCLNFSLLESCGPVASISRKTNDFGAQRKNLEAETWRTGAK